MLRRVLELNLPGVLMQPRRFRVHLRLPPMHIRELGGASLFCLLMGLFLAFLRVLGALLGRHSTLLPMLREVAAVGGLVHPSSIPHRAGGVEHLKGGDGGANL